MGPATAKRANGWRGANSGGNISRYFSLLITGISKVQISELTEHGNSTMKALAGVALPLEWKPHRGSASSYTRACMSKHEFQWKPARAAKHALGLCLRWKQASGKTSLPDSSEGDIFLDLEGDAFVGEQGLEYLFGYLSKDGNGALVYQHN